MLSARQEQIKSLVHQSPILSSQEREEWLALLELMNDKQLSELENILRQPLQETTFPAPASPSPRPQPLGHITNLPQGVELPKMPSPAASKWFDGLKLALNEKELPPGTDEAMLPPATFSPKTPQQKSFPPSPEPLKSRPSAAKFSSFVAKTSSSNPGQPKWQPNAAEDASRLDVENLRRLGETVIIGHLQKLVRSQGYLKVLQYLESSSLYKLYLALGQQMLETGSADFVDGEMSKEEFEQVADILRSIQVN